MDTTILRVLVIPNSDRKPRDLFKHAPEPISLDKIEETTDIYALEKLEKAYNTFIDEESDLIYYHDILDECLKIRDALLVRISTLRRIDNMKQYFQLK